MTNSRSGEPRTPRGGPPDCCEVVTVPARQGLEAVDILRRGGTGDAVGPVLHDDGGCTLGFLVPPGTAAGWDVPGSTCRETYGRGLPLTPAFEASAPGPPAEGPDWLLPPEGTDLATDPAALREALGEAQRLLDVTDGCR
ncbi:hypothetical protein [Streptomyces hirsutus]|uniref:hypothetical protein n=1 Tax=Streptomyces hirsutus TaxID=35620 RepID=UPI00099EEA5F|nr:hypothetical protein [Streptomyces hirsutus]